MPRVATQLGRCVIAGVVTAVLFNAHVGPAFGEGKGPARVSQVAAGIAIHESGLFDTMGGPGEDSANNIAVDSRGNVYVGGQYSDGAAFGPDGTDVRRSSGGYDAYLSKYDASGNRQWTYTWGGSDLDAVTDVSLDGADNVYVTGWFSESVDFAPGDGIDVRRSAGFTDAYLVKFGADGAYSWARTWGGPGHDYGYGVAAEASGQVYVTGRFSLTADFNPGPGIDARVSAGSTDAYLAKFGRDGTYQWVRAWGGVGGAGGDAGNSVALDPRGNVFVTGWWSSTVDFDPGLGLDVRTVAGYQDVFVSKYTGDGRYAWTKTWGGTYADFGANLTFDGRGNLFVSGRFGTTVDFDPGPGVDQRTSNGDTDLFLAKFGGGESYEWVRTWGGAGYDDAGYFGGALATDVNGSVYATGVFTGGVDFDATAGSDVRATVGVPDEQYAAFVTSYRSDGTYQWTTTTNSSLWTGGYSMAVDRLQNIHFTGQFYGTMQLDLAGSIPVTSTGAGDAFVVSFSSESAGQVQASSR